MAPLAGAPPLAGAVPLATSLRTVAFGANGRTQTRTPALAGSGGFSAMKVDFTKTGIADQGFVIANFAKRYGVTTIFLQVAGDDIGQLEAHDPQTVANLNAMFDVATVYVMTGDPSWLDATTMVPGDVTEIVRKIAPEYPRFAGILYDLEPLPTQAVAYFHLLDTLLGGSQPYVFGTTILQTSPSWWRLPNSTGTKSPSMLQQAESYPVVSQTYFAMRGYSAASQMTNDVVKALPQLAKPYWSGADAEAPLNSYLGQSPAYLASNLSLVASDVVAINPRLAGIAIDEWDDRYGALQTILPQPTPAPIPQPTGPLVPPVGFGYLGAYVGPNDTGSGSVAVAAFEAAIGRKLAYDLHFLGFTSPLNGSILQDDVANGRVPLVALQCADSNARVASGVDDAQIRASALSAAAFHHPLFLRFLWEMNLPVQKRRAPCYDPATDLPKNKLSPVHFIAAWRHMHALFEAAGATNVIWVWNESGGGATPAEYYPGDDVVDWVGIDSYDRNDTPFLTIFAPLLNSTAQYKKPIMICETGARPEYQAPYFPEIVDAIPAVYPLVKAVSYFDSSDAAGAWALTPSGIAAFASLGRQPAFSAFAKL